MLLALFGFLAVLVFYWRKLYKLYNFWASRGIKQRKQIYLLGDFAGVLTRKETLSDAIQAIYNAFPNERYVGFYQLLQPILMIRDLELIKRVTIKDFDHFIDQRPFLPEGIDPLWNNNLFALKGDNWRHMRAMLTPSFTISKMKIMHPLICECVVNVLRYFSDRRNDIIPLDFKEVSNRFTCDVLAALVLCIKCDSLKDPENEVYLRTLEITDNFDGFKNFLKHLVMSAPKLAKCLRLSLLKTDAKIFFMRHIKENIKMREDQKLFRQDMTHLLLETRKGKSPEEEGPIPASKSPMTDEDIAAQSLLFYFGGFDTTTLLMNFLAYELSLNVDVQSKLQREIDDALKEYGDGLQHYDCIVKLKYMDMVMSETLRKWSSTAFVGRTCVKPYTIAPEKPTEKPVHIQPGDLIAIPIFGIHHDPKYYEQPEKFNPERFSDENKNKINVSAYLPFGIGPRNCIGSRLALLVAKVFFFYLLSKFELVTVKKSQVPIRLQKCTFLLNAENGFWVGLKRRCT